jgi:hypothetical protein
MTVPTALVASVDDPCAHAKAQAKAWFTAWLIAADGVDLAKEKLAAAKAESLYLEPLLHETKLELVAAQGAALEALHQFGENSPEYAAAQAEADQLGESVEKIAEALEQWNVAWASAQNELFDQQAKLDMAAEAEKYWNGQADELCDD